MAKARKIRERAKAVENVRVVTKTMEMVSSARFKRVFGQAAAARPYTDRLSDLVGDLLARTPPGELDHPLLVEDPQLRRDVLLVITTNRGLCGMLNSSVLRLATERIEQLRAAGYEVLLHVVGKRGVRHFRFRGVAMDYENTELGDLCTYEQVLELTDPLMDAFLKHGISGVEVAYMQFVSPGQQTPVIAQILPLSSLEAPPRRMPSVGEPPPYEFLPRPKEILAELLPATVRLRMYQCFLDSSLSEQLVRARAMQNASQNAEEMLTQLAAEANRLRQKQITAELAEIVSGAGSRGKPAREPLAVRRFQEMLRNPEGRIEVEVTSAAPLSQAHVGRVRRMLRQIGGGKPLLKLTVDPKVLGGLVIRVGDRVYDASVGGKLDSLAGRYAAPPSRGGQSSLRPADRGPGQ